MLCHGTVGANRWKCQPGGIGKTFKDAKIKLMSGIRKDVSKSLKIVLDVSDWLAGTRLFS